MSAWLALPNAQSHIRLLQLKTGNSSSNLDCSLETIEIEPSYCGSDRGDWTALSYCWGDEIKDESINIVLWEHGTKKQVVPISITKNLASALRHVSSTGETRKLWVDQICINQDDDVERAQQILIMDKIFARSACTIAWLGERSIESDLLFTVLDDSVVKDSPMVSRKPRDLAGLDGESSKLPQSPTAYETKDQQIWHSGCIAAGVHTDHTDLAFYDGLLEALTHTLTRPWFQRVWTVQEAVLPIDLVFQAGNKQSSSKALSNLLEGLHEGGHSSFSSIHRGIFVKPYGVFALRKLWSSQRQDHIDVPVVLDMSRYRAVRDARDKVYGLLGLLKQKPEFASSTTFAPSYQKSTEQVYMETMATLIDADGSPDPLKFCCGERKGSKLNLPSWCEDYSAALTCGPQGARSMYKRPRIFHAASSKPCKTAFLPQHQALMIKATMLDLVETMVYPARSEADYDSVWSQWLQLCNGEHPVDDLCRVLIADHETDSPVFQRARPAFMQKLVQCVVDPNLRLKLTELQQQFPRAAARIKDTLDMFCVFRTTRGFIGASCKHVCVDDHLALLHGAKLPCLLREAQTQPIIVDKRGPSTGLRSFRMIGGECFVGGLADNQGILLAREDNIEDEDICLV